MHRPPNTPLPIKINQRQATKSMAWVWPKNSDRCRHSIIPGAAPGVRKFPGPPSIPFSSCPVPGPCFGKISGAYGNGGMPPVRLPGIRSRSPIPRRWLIRSRPRLARSVFKLSASRFMTMTANTGKTRFPINMPSWWAP